MFLLFSSNCSTACFDLNLLVVQFFFSWMILIGDFEIGVDENFGFCLLGLVF